MIRSETTTQEQSVKRASSHEIEITHHEVTVANLPPSADGLTVVQLSDLHRGCGNTDGLIKEAIARANSQEPDYVFVTGDFVDEHASDVLPVVKMVSGLRAAHGVYACIGNHDHRGDPVLLQSALEAAGINVLYNTATEVMSGLWFAGVDELYEGQPDLDAALSPVPNGAALLFLAHHPDTLDRVPVDKPMFILSGHTHGGQIVLPFPNPWMVCRFHLRTRFVHGWYTRGQAQLYVNRGIGVTGSGPFGRRFRCLPEISVFRLRCDSNRTGK